jgi:Lrp/AsnC family transcriptional regulator, regulator for asnA, asnC and gidA
MEEFNKDEIASLDDLDEKIINELIDDAKIPLRELASRLGVSFVTIMNRIKRLEKEGVIKGYTTQIDYDKTGYNIHVLIEVRIAKGKLLELEKKIARSPTVNCVYDTTGEFDATIIGRFRSTRAMDNFLKHIQTFDFVERTNTKLILNTIKEKPIRL